MLFNLGKYEMAIILVVAFFFLGLPIIAWFLARRKQRQGRENP